MVKTIEVESNRLCLPEDYFYIVFPNGIGDTLITTSYLKAYKETNHISKICMIVKENQKEIPTWFSGVDAYMISNELTTALMEWSIQNQIWALDNYLFGNVPKNITFTASQSYEPFFMDRFRKNVLNLPETAVRELPEWDIQNIEELNWKYQINEHTILLLPYAQTSDSLPLLFWEQLAMRLSAMGYTVYTNGKDDFETAIINTQLLCESINDTAVLASSVGMIIGLRSGLCDVLACTKTPLITIDTNPEYFTNWNLTHVEGYEHITSVLYESPEDIEPLISMIMEKLNP